MSLTLSQVRCWCLQVNQLSRWSQTTWTGRSQCSTLLLRPACTRCTSSTTAHTSQVSTQHTHTHWLVNRIRWKGDTWCPERELQPLRRRPALRMFGHWSQSENEIWSLMFLLYWYCVFVLQSLLFSSMWTTPVVPVSQPTVLVWATASPTRWRRSPSSQMTPLKVRQLQEEEQSWSSDSSRSWGDSEQEFYFSKSVKTSWFKCTLSICLSVPGGLDLAIEGPSKAEISCVDNKDGTCSVTYLPTLPGDYNILVKYNSDHIAGSPFTAKITGETLKETLLMINKPKNQIINKESLFSFCLSNLFSFNVDHCNLYQSVKQ